MNNSIDDIDAKINHKEERLKYLSTKIDEYLNKVHVHRDMRIIKGTIIGSLGFGSIVVCGIGMFTNSAYGVSLIKDFIIPVCVITYGGVVISHVFCDVYSKIKTGLTMGNLKKYLDNNREEHLDYNKRRKNIYSDIIRLRVERTNLIKEQERLEEFDRKEESKIIEQQNVIENKSNIINFKERARLLVRKPRKK